MTFSTSDERFLLDDLHRFLQVIPDFTSPPNDVALAATPEAFRSDDVVDSIRTMAAEGNCSADQGDESMYCHIPFEPPADMFEPSKIGMIFFGGGLVDPRGYSPLAKLVAERFGIPVVVPIFARDLSLVAATICDGSGRLPFAQAQFDSVEKWVFAGHSLGGVAAAIDVWLLMMEATMMNSDAGNENNQTASSGEDILESVGGLVMLAADVQNLGCGDTDFSGTDFPMALVAAAEDKILNQTRYASNFRRRSNATFFVEIEGGTHGQFGSYDASGRFDALGQVDGIPTIPAVVQWEISLGAILHVASRVGVPLPAKMIPTTASETTSFPTSGTTGFPTASPSEESSESQDGSSGSVPSMASTNIMFSVVFPLLVFFTYLRGHS